jgi:hypothetical protein
VLLDTDVIVTSSVNDAAAGYVDAGPVRKARDVVALFKDRCQSRADSAFNANNENVIHALASLRLCLEIRQSIELPKSGWRAVLPERRQQ